MLAGVAQVDIVGPAVAEVIAEAVEETLEWCHCGDDPIAEQRDTAAIGRARLDGPADLNGKSDGLGEQDRHQDQNILIACDKRFHALVMIICESARMRSWRG